METTSILPAEPNKSCAHGAQPSPVSPSDLKKMVKDRREVDATELAMFARTAVRQNETACALTKTLLEELQRRFDRLSKEKGVDGEYPTIDGARSFNGWLELHNIPKRNVYYKLNGRPKRTKTLPPWGKIDGTKVEVIFSAAHKCIRRGNETDAIAWLQRLYLNGFDVWKQLHLYAVEDVGLADLSIPKHIQTLEATAKRIKDDHNSDWLAIIEAVMLMCRAQKSRATDDAAIYFRENPDYMPPTEEIQEVFDAGQLPKPVVRPDYLDKHTTEGRKNGRGLEDFMKTETAALANKSDVSGFKPPSLPSGTVPFLLTEEQVCYLSALLEREQDSIAAELRVVLAATASHPVFKPAPSKRTMKAAA